jgi:ribose/xylose/arabinose/galactoside ABC-type transport system permease subunit
VKVVGPLLLVVLVALRLPALRDRLRALAAVSHGGRRPGPGAIAVHGFAGLLAAGAGIMLAGYGGEFRVGIADVFALPVLLAVAAGGLGIGDGRGDPIGLLGAVPMVIALDTVMVGAGMSFAQRQIAMGAALLAIILLRGLAGRRPSPAAVPQPEPARDPR